MGAICYCYVQERNDEFGILDRRPISAPCPDADLCKEGTTTRLFYFVQRAGMPMMEYEYATNVRPPDRTLWF